MLARTLTFGLIALVAGCDPSVTSTAPADAASPDPSATSCMCEGIGCYNGALLHLRWPQPLLDPTQARVEVCRLPDACLSVPLTQFGSAQGFGAELRIQSFGSIDVTLRWNEFTPPAAPSFSARASVLSVGASYSGEGSGSYGDFSIGRCFPPKENPSLDCSRPATSCRGANVEIVLTPSDAGSPDAATDASADASDAD